MASSDNIEDIVTDQADWFEQMVLASALTDTEFLNDYGQLICYNDKENTNVDDFASPHDNVIFCACRTFHILMSSSGSPHLKPDLAFIHSAIKNAINDGRMLEEEEMVAFKRAQYCCNLDVTPYRDMIREGVPVWLEKVRVRKSLFKHRKNKKLNSELVISEIRDSLSTLKQATQEKYSFKASEGLDAPGGATIRYPTSLTGLNNILGGGVGKGESCMIVAPEGAGKTLLGLMLHCDLTIDNGLNGLFISTEQGNAELLPRMVSARCEIPFKDIVDGVYLSKLKTDRQREDVKGLVQSLDKSRTVEWKRGRSRGIVQDIDREIDLASEAMGSQVQYVIFDWLGRGADSGNLTTEDFKYMRYLYQQSADYMADIARKRQIIVILFMQATMALALNKPRVDATMIAECKSAGANQTQVLGVSAMMHNIQEVKMNTATPSYTLKQFIFASKTRKAAGHLVPVARMFEYQKFVDWKTREVDEQK